MTKLSNIDISPLRSRRERLITLTIVSILAFNYPLLSLFNYPILVLGIPLLYLYLFCTWAIFIALVAWILESQSRRTKNDSDNDLSQGS
ncbi:MAG: hypothetical protein BWK79_00940 [Beggiatoa sp. IS2]|nr:MAG: hypothetical protein BWK79_00940 [Beggiatoa sp. IS2]